MNEKRLARALLDGVGVGSRNFGERTLDAALAFADGRAAALFAREQEKMVLVASRGIDQGGLDIVERAWAAERGTLERGQSVHSSSADWSLAITPVREGSRLVGLLYVLSDGHRFTEPRDLEALGQLCGIAAMALAAGPGEPTPPAAVDTYLERTPLGEVAREQLLVLLQRNEWNIARVARLMGVTRPTIYKRLERYGLERKHEPKAPMRRQPA